MKTIVTFLLGVLVGAGGLVALQRPGPALILSRLFPSHAQPPQIVPPQVPVGSNVCEPAWFCIHGNDSNNAATDTTGH